MSTERERLSEPLRVREAGLCHVCRWRDPKGEPRCEAYPEGIPQGILAGTVDHTVNRPGDHGIRFAPIARRHPDGAVRARLVRDVDNVVLGALWWSTAEHAEGWLDAGETDRGAVWAERVRVAWRATAYRNVATVDVEAQPLVVEGIGDYFAESPAQGVLFTVGDPFTASSLARLAAEVRRRARQSAAVASRVASG